MPSRPGRVSHVNAAQLRTLIERVAAGHIVPADAERDLLEALRAKPFEDLGFARVDHHRAIRQGFPEVVLGLGKTPAQVAAIAERIASRGASVLVTQAGPEIFAAVKGALPDAVHYPDARIVALRRDDTLPGKGKVLVVAAGTSDLSVAEEAACTA